MVLKVTLSIRDYIYIKSERKIACPCDIHTFFAIFPNVKKQWLDVIYKCPYTEELSRRKIFLRKNRRGYFLTFLAF